jgi:hypothetical protein
MRSLGRTALAVLDEARHRPRGNDLGDRWVALDREQLAEACCRLELLIRVG